MEIILGKVTMSKWQSFQELGCTPTNFLQGDVVSWKRVANSKVVILLQVNKGLVNLQVNYVVDRCKHNKCLGIVAGPMMNPSIKGRRAVQKLQPQGWQSGLKTRSPKCCQVIVWTVLSCFVFNHFQVFFLLNMGNNNPQRGCVLRHLVKPLKSQAKRTCITKL